MNEHARWARAMRRRNLAAGTVDKYLAAVRDWERWLAGRPATRHEVEGWLDAHDWCARTRYCKVSALHAWYRWARREGLVADDPTVDVERPRLPRRLPRPIRRATADRAVREADPPWDRALALMAYGGLRCGEVARLSWSDVDLAAGVLWVRGKGDRDRVVPVAPILARYLAPWDGSAGPVIPNTEGEHFTPARLSQRTNRVLRSCGIVETAHQLRHTAATVMLELSGGDIAAVQSFLGHASIATTAIYAAVSPEAVRRAAARWE